MDQNSKMKLMLFAVTVLAAIKFGLLPVLEWQAQVIDEIQAIEKRNNKSERLLANQQQLFMEMAQLGQAYKAKAEAFPSYPDSTSFRLETQIMFEQILKMDELKSKRFFWRESEDVQVFGNLYKASFNVTFNGLSKNFALLHSKIASNYPQYRVPNMSANLQGYNEKSLGLVETTMTVEAYYWRGGAQ